MTSSQTAEPLDCVGIGFGPSNLALAIAMQEAGNGLSCHFLERHPDFVWHGDMLLDGSRMQICFLKDLVSMRKPTSPFSFLNYLHEHGRFEDFINTRTFYPSRREFNDYLRWAAGHFDAQCSYGQEVLAIEPEWDHGRVRHVRVHARDQHGQERYWLARNVVIATGGQPCVPDAFAGLNGHAQVIHSSRYLSAADRLGKAERVAVVGFGQSAAEIFLDLHGKGVAVDLIARASTLRPADSSSFVNEIFNADYTDYFFHRPLEERRQLVGDFSSTNYSVVDNDLIEEIFDTFYQQKVMKDERHRLSPRHEVLAARAQDGQLQLDLRNLDDGSHDMRRFDGVVLATGYRHTPSAAFLDAMAPCLESLAPARDYRLPATPLCDVGIYLQGCCEATHGLSDSLLSVLPARAEEIAVSLRQTSAEQAAPAVACAAE
ncbi:lysine N(6)-hydroxylase/L-ornithine N(5)-oxygenase family protein [Novosphingobium beihaiensis]|uniref:Lysine N(6)-hydroxylase/L-ornithine N(5)-oxygenase family protein n=1 Tax=Novosphingobium beihaiensis TaxID=2930389 RepID=A0ABT0BTA4_9SPHN|nr:lysine N(6)-hydroxylase/L-ornithine N(5)-oxygenase family protein [Novosphingobium beihaiensis]MCJ2188290.1 lysine N(6)-hydroxylase/L-ornithine N(5)-oxygenase family protein [Novosphingobium beihaiensis]